MNDKVKAHMALAKECGAITYTHRSNPHEAAVSFGPAAWEKFCSAIALQAEQAQPGFVMVPVDVLERVSESLGSFVSDQGWSDQDMQNMDNLDAFIARHKANLAARPSEPPKRLSDDEIDAIPFRALEIGAVASFREYARAIKSEVLRRVGICNQGGET